MATMTGNNLTKRSEAGIWLIVLGALALILGLIGFFMTFALTLVSTLWYGALREFVSKNSALFRR